MRKHAAPSGTEGWHQHLQQMTVIKINRNLSSASNSYFCFQIWNDSRVHATREVTAQPCCTYVRSLSLDLQIFKQTQVLISVIE